MLSDIAKYIDWVFHEFRVPSVNYKFSQIALLAVANYR